MIDRKHFGKRVGAERRRLGMTQGDLAEALAVTAQAVSKWERGESLPDPELLLALSRLTGRSINALLEDRDPFTEMGLPGETRDGVRVLTGSRDLSAYDPFVRMLRQETDELHLYSLTIPAAEKVAGSGRVESDRRPLPECPVSICHAMLEAVIPAEDILLFDTRRL